MNLDLRSFTPAQLAELEQQAKQVRLEKSLKDREAYEGIRAQFIQQMQQKVCTVVEDVKGLYNYVVEQTIAFKEVLAEYGQLRKSDQLGYTVTEGDFRVEVKSCKVKRFDERADAAAIRLIEFLGDWIKKSKSGTEDPMYQLAMTLLERNKYGDLDYKSVSKLYDLENRFNDPEYSSIMDLFKESNVVEGTATNYYFSKRDEKGVWRKVEPSFNRM